MRADGLCSKCGEPHDSAGRYCLKCHAAYMRAWRKTHPLTGEALRKANVRSYAGVYRRRGLIPQEDCRMCGSSQSQMHHPDYDKPLEVVWLCRLCHLALHQAEKAPDFDSTPKPKREAA